MGWGTPPDTCQRAAPSGLPLCGPRKYEDGLGHTPRPLPKGGALWTPALWTEEVRRRVGAHPQTPAKGRRPLDSRFEVRGSTKGLEDTPRHLPKGGALWTPALRTEEVRRRVGLVGHPQDTCWGTPPDSLPMWLCPSGLRPVSLPLGQVRRWVGGPHRPLPKRRRPLDSGPFRYALGQRLTLSLELRHALDGAGFGHHAIDEREDEHER